MAGTSKDDQARANTTGFSSPNASLNNSIAGEAIKNNLASLLDNCDAGGVTSSTAGGAGRTRASKPVPTRPASPPTTSASVIILPAQRSRTTRSPLWKTTMPLAKRAVPWTGQGQIRVTCKGSAQGRLVVLMTEGHVIDGVGGGQRRMLRGCTVSVTAGL